MLIIVFPLPYNIYSKLIAPPQPSFLLVNPPSFGKNVNNERPDSFFIYKCNIYAFSNPPCAWKSVFLYTVSIVQQYMHISTVCFENIVRTKYFQRLYDFSAYVLFTMLVEINIYGFQWRCSLHSWSLLKFVDILSFLLQLQKSSTDERSINFIMYQIMWQLDRVFEQHFQLVVL